jgi:conjugal transfer pilus assembly protein TraB
MFGKWFKDKAVSASKQETNEIVSLGVKSLQAKKKQDKTFWLMLVAGGVILTGILQYQSLKGGGANSKAEEEGKLTVEVAEKALDAEKMWRNHFEDKLLDRERKADNRIELIENSINEQTRLVSKEVKAELEQLKGQLKQLIEEQLNTRRELNEAKRIIEEKERNIELGTIKAIESNVVVNDLERDEEFDLPKASNSFIPETAYVKGVLLGGIAVSTALGSSSEPVPVVIRITDSGNLPKDFIMDMRKCRLLGSSYGDLSSERAVIRAETLSCQDEANGLVHTTKVAGIIFGDDGLNGIKGKVVQTSNKHLKNAVVGSMLSGFAGVAKGQESFNIGSGGVIASNKKGIGDLAKEGGVKRSK